MALCSNHAHGQYVPADWIFDPVYTPSVTTQTPGDCSVGGALYVGTHANISNDCTVGGPLQIQGGLINMVTAPSTDIMQRNISAYSTYRGISINSGSDSTDGSVITVNAKYNYLLPGQITFISNITNNPPSGSPAVPAFAFQTQDNTTIHQNLVTISKQGWLGVNTATPGVELDVNGNGKIENNLSVSNDATIDHNLSVGNDATINHNLTVDNDATIDHNLTVGNDESINHNVTVGGYEIIDGILYPSSGQIYMTNPLVIVPDIQRNLSGGSYTHGININAAYGGGDGSSISIGAVECDSNGQIALQSVLWDNSWTIPAFAFQIILPSVYTVTPFEIYDDGQVSLSPAGYIPNTPEELTLENGLYLHQSTDNADRIIVGRTNTGIVGIFSGDDDLTSGRFYTLDSTPYKSGSSVVINGINNATTPGQISLTANTAGIYTAATCPTTAYSFQRYDGSHLDTPMEITYDGRVVIGTDLASSCNWQTYYRYNLYVSKGILTEKLKVANSTDGPNWSDYVFDKDYHLMPLAQLESFVKANKHLPEIPTADDVKKDGIDVADMDAKLLKKSEELTLYVIVQQKEIEELKKEMAEMKKQMSEKK